MSINFYNENGNDFKKQINEKTYLVVNRMSNCIAKISFYDNENKKINIPSNIKIYVKDYQNVKNKSLINPVNEEYFLHWMDCYSIEKDGYLFVDIKSERTFNFHSF